MRQSLENEAIARIDRLIQNNILRDSDLKSCLQYVKVLKKPGWRNRLYPMSQKELWFDEHEPAGPSRNEKDALFQYGAALNICLINLREPGKKYPSSNF